MNCRHCNADLRDTFVDLVSAPPSNAFLSKEGLTRPESWFPLKVLVCRSCFLVQLPVHKSSEEIFDSNYAYFSSYSTSWLKHAEAYVEMIIERLSLDASSRVAEVASNDGYLLKNFLPHGIPCLGIEPSANTAEVAQSLGVETIVAFFSRALATRLVAERGHLDLIIGNNVLAHTPDINDFVGGLAIALAPEGTITLEFPHLLKLMAESQFDTIYHEHFSYLSLLTVTRIFGACGLRIYDVEELPTHGGSLRIYACHGGASMPTQDAVERVLGAERDVGLDRIEGYQGFAEQVSRIRDDFVAFLVEAHRKGATVAGYGAAAKGNTLLNYCGVRGNDIIEFVVDRSPHKSGMFLPGSHIPVVDEDELRQRRPDYVVVFPWNLMDEITSQLSYIGEWGGRFVRAVPRLEIVEASG